MRAPIILALALPLGGCGYTFGARGGTTAIEVAPIEEPGLDVDAGALVGAAVRRAIARGPGTTLATAGTSEERLEVELLASPAGLQPFSDLAARAAEYRQVVTVRARLVDLGGRELWRSEAVTGEAPFISPPGPVERLEGARRRALERAAEDAAERLVAGLRWRAPTTSGLRGTAAQPKAEEENERAVRER